MNSFRKCIYVFFIVCLLPACEFKCSIGSAKKNKPHEAFKPVIKDGAIISNGIQLTTGSVKLRKAYLVFENGEEVPANNVIDYKSPVKLLLLIDSGWRSQNGHVWLGGAEKVLSEEGKVVLDEEDLFAPFSEGVSADDAKIIGLTVTINITKGYTSSFTVFFKVWDKKGKGYIEGNYKLFSK